MDYLGIFPDRRSAQAVHDKAAQSGKKRGSGREQLRPFTVPDPPLSALGRRDEWLSGSALRATCCSESGSFEE